MNTAQIHRIAILPFGMLNCHLIVGSQGCILVDAGLPGSRRKIERALRQHQLRWQDIKLIVITHAHIDHAGSAARVRQLSGAPIVAHQADAAHYAREKEMTFCSTGWVGNLLLRSGTIQRPYTPFVPDILLQDGQELSLAEYGINGRIIHTPGHTAGSISVQMQEGDAMLGDLLASGVFLGGIIRSGHAKRPPFEDNPHEVAQQLQDMLKAGMQRFYIGHGGPLEAKEVARHARWLAGLPARVSNEKICSEKHPAS